MSAAVRIDEKLATQLLADKHSGDLFVAQCKNGPTQGAPAGTLAILDAWVMARIWAHPRTIGYEIKVSRRDFLGDTKWPSYLPLCNELWFVCPSGLISPDEVGPDVGLMWVAKTGTRLFTKKKAVYRDIEPPIALMSYVLMCRTEVQPEYRRESEAEYWQRWLEEREKTRELGYTVRGKISEIWEETKRENDRLKKRMEKYDDVRAALQKLGLDPAALGSWRLHEQIAEAAACVPDDLVTALRQIQHEADHVAGKLDAFCRRVRPDDDEALTK